MKPASNAILLAIILKVLSAPAKCQQKSFFNPDQIDIPFKKFTLENGLTLIVHEDHKAPIVAVNILDELQQLSRQAFNPGQVKWFVIGDKTKILAPLKELGYELIELDPDGNILK